MNLDKNYLNDIQYCLENYYNKLGRCKKVLK